MNLLDTLLPIVGVLATVGLPTAALIFSYRANRPYKVVGHSPSMGMVAIRWRDDSERTYWLTPAHLAEQIGLHR